jgi:hypothetical protein
MCIDGSVDESIMNHNGTQKYFILEKNTFLRIAV